MEQDVRLAGKSYVLVPKAEYERLRRLAASSSEESAAFAVPSLGPDLRSRRREAALTLKEVAQRAGIRLETLSRIETGRTNPSAKTVQAVLRALKPEVG